MHLIESLVKDLYLALDLSNQPMLRLVWALWRHLLLFILIFHSSKATTASLLILLCKELLS